jgi:hypothetical protein
LVPLPGSELIGAGYEPSAKGGLCEFDECRTRQIFNWTYEQERMVDTPAGIFRIPDQLKMLNIYRTDAKTRIYQNEQQREQSLAIQATVSFSGYGVSAKASAGYGSSSASATSESIAERSIELDLYTLQADITSLNDVNPMFRQELELLPERFSQGPHSYLNFVRHWGRYVVRGGQFGGSLTMTMKMSSSSQSSTQDIAVGVEAAYDGICSAAGSFSMDMSSKAKSLMAESKISIKTSGGDPQVASTITDMLPGSDKTASFRKDVLSWIKSVPVFPRLNAKVPQLTPLYSILPTDEDPSQSIQWTLKRTALQYAHNVFATDPQGAKHFDSRLCKAPPAGKDTQWNDFDRISTDQCLAFAAQISSNLSVFIAAAPSLDSLRYRLDITSHKVVLYLGSTELESSILPLGVAPGMPGLVGDFWICLTSQPSSSMDLTFKYGRGEHLILERKIQMVLAPRYFAFSCGTLGSIISVGIHPANLWSKYVLDKKICYIQDCVKYEKIDECTCKKCGVRRILNERQTECKIDPVCALSSNGF